MLCYFCRSEGFLGLGVCAPCHSRILRTCRFEGCGRCGKSGCVGQCGRLRGFMCVRAPFRLDAPLASLLTDAKDNDAPHAQSAFESLFAESCTREIDALVRTWGVTHISFCALRLARILKGGWHPIQVLASSSEKAVGPQSVRILDPCLSFQFRQATTPSHRRDARLRRRETSADLQTAVRAEPGSERRLLVLDDVLTSGESAFRSCAALTRKWGPFDRFLLFSILRTPRKDA